MNPAISDTVPDRKKPRRGWAGASNSSQVAALGWAAACYESAPLMLAQPERPSEGWVPVRIDCLGLWRGP
jgi:hypothetical protein